MRKRIISAGHICLDITPVFDPSLRGSVSDLLAPGKLIHVDKANIHTGGSVANTGLALKHLGADVELMGKVGTDPFGDIVADALGESAAGLVRDPDSSTSYSIVLAPPGVDRIFLHNPGANDSFRSADIPDKTLQGAALLHFGYPPLMREMYLRDGAELVDLFRRAKALGVATSLDLAAVDPNSEAGQADWEAILKNVMPYVDFFVPSAEELCFMLDRPRYEEWGHRAAGVALTDVLDVEKDVAPLADKLMGWGAKVVLIKCGAPGMYCRTADEQTLRAIGAGAEVEAAAWGGHSAYEPSFKASRVVSGTGAGDTSIAAFLISMLEGLPPRRCVERALATGACCVESYDALSALPSLRELDARIAAGWARTGA